MRMLRAIATARGIDAGASRLKRPDGFTLVETAITVSILALVLGGAITVAFHAELWFVDEFQQLNLDQTGATILQRLGDELRPAYPTTVLPLVINNSDYTDFQKVTGYQNGSVVLGPVNRFSHTMAPGESKNGRDDNGDGRTDEGFLTLTIAGAGGAAAQTIQLAGNVVGLRFKSTTNGLAFGADIAVVDREGNVVQRTFSQEIAFRNSAP